MAILPTGFELPALPYVVGLVVALGFVLLLARVLEPPITRPLVLAFVPWMLTGAALNVLFGLGAFPPALAPFFGTPAVYITTFVVACLVWLVTELLSAGRLSEQRVPRRLAAVGGGTTLVFSSFVLWQAIGFGTPRILWPTVGAIVGVLLGIAAYFLLGIIRGTATAYTGSLGLIVMVGHALDGVSTAVGVDLFGASEQSPLPRAIMNFAGDLPTAEIIGVGWLFVVVKLLIAGVVVVLLADYVHERPTEGDILLAFVAAVGLGPAVHNLLLFLVPA